MQVIVIVYFAATYLADIFGLASRIDPRYTRCTMIKTFKHKGLERFYLTGSKRGIQAAHAARLEDQLVILARATAPSAMDIPGWNLHPLKGELKGHWSVKVNGNWRMTFYFEDGDAILVDYQDYH